MWPERCPYTGPSQKWCTAFMIVRSRLTGGPGQHQACLRQQADLQHNGVPRQHGMGLPRLLIQASPAAHLSLRLPGAGASSPQAITGGQTSWGRLGIPCVVLGPFPPARVRPRVHGAPIDLWPAPPSSLALGRGGGRHRKWGPPPSALLLFFSIYLSLSWLHWVLAGSGMQNLRFLTRDFLCGGHGLSSCGAWPPECPGSAAVTRRLRSSEACGISVPQSGTEPRSPTFQGGFLTTDHQGIPPQPFSF